MYKRQHLLFEAVAVVLNGFRCHHMTHIGKSGWITDHSGTATDQCDRSVSGHLKKMCIRDRITSSLRPIKECFTKENGYPEDLCITSEMALHKVDSRKMCIRDRNNGIF